MDWSKLPDLLAVGLLAWAFASVARRSQNPVSSLWLIGWLLIVLHFAALLFVELPGAAGFAAELLAVLCLVWAALLLMRASVPYRELASSRAMLAVLFATYTLYICSLQGNSPLWLRNSTASLLGLGPLAIGLGTWRTFRHPFRWATIFFQCALAAVLLYVHQHPTFHADLPYDAVLFTVYLGCALHFCFGRPRGSAGASITMAGFFAWASVFVVAPLIRTYFQKVQIEDEVWNLPKFVVAAGMILLLLEEQIAHNKHLALHDPLTGLPNRRLFQDRLASALERARRMGAATALLILDLDRFKQVNDTLGHHVGDLLLKNVATLLDSRVRRSDTVARTGGDEFAIILEAPTSREEAALVRRSLLDLLNQPMELEKNPVKVGASIGFAVFPEDALDVESLFIKADLRMYDSKRATAATEAPATTAPYPDPHSLLQSPGSS